jgi:flavin-binding protein dodecin
MLRTGNRMTGDVPSCSPRLKAVSAVLKRPLGRMIPVLLAMAFIAAPASAQRMYKCVDAKGKTYYTQVPPAECLGRETQELNQSGTIARKLEAVLTPEQQAAREAERKKKLEDEEKAKEQARKNTALLNTYSSEKDIDDARVRALQEAEDSIKQTEKNLVDSQARRQELAAEKEFYLKKPVPFKLAQDINKNELDIKTQTGLLEAKKKEISSISAKYDEDKRRYQELTKSRPQGSAAPASSQSKK